jgi:hypothetical protein
MLTMRNDGDSWDAGPVERWPGGVWPVLAVGVIALVAEGRHPVRRVYGCWSSHPDSHLGSLDGTWAAGRT